MRRTSSLRKLNRILQEVKGFGEQMKKLSDRQLSNLTVAFRKRLDKGESLDDILPEAFAAVCEADRRVLGQFPFDVQVLGAIALHQGKLAEMNTGEGKTLTATMPLYLNALSGKSTILLTANEYLALRDAQEMGRVYRFMGLTIAAGVCTESGRSFTSAEKKAIYASDIVYTTHGALGFDYLFNNLVTTASDRFLRDFYYVIIDEADSVLLDSAQTPLVIAGAPRVQSNLYELADFFVTTLIRDRDYEKEENKVWLTEEGVKYAERFFQIQNFYEERFFEINRHVVLALRAHVLFEPEKQYVVSKNGEICLLDEGSGRMMPGVKLRGGQHQALETKEKLKISQENRSVAAITYQNFFQLFPKMSGMSGTIADAAEELRKVYRTEVVVIPPNCPVRRRDLRDMFYRDAHSQYNAAVAATAMTHRKGQPVLIVVNGIRETEFVSKRLLAKGIPHNVLNANNAAWEAEIIKEAGRANAVTVATGMAGRGTDIRLGKGVKELGGLAVIGIGRMGDVRLERQARGRAGRQGDPGFSCFFVSLEDEVVVNNTPQKWNQRGGDRKRISRRRLKKIVNTAQKTGEEFAVLARKQAMEYDQILSYQRNLIYEIRNKLLDGEGMDQQKFLEIARTNVKKFIATQTSIDGSVLGRYILDHISYRLDEEIREVSQKDPEEVEEYLVWRVRRALAEKKIRIGSRENLYYFMRIAALNAVDEGWVEQVDYLQQMQSAVMGRTSAQRNPVFEFHKDALEAYQKMEADILNNIMRNVLLGSVYKDNEGRIHIQLP